MVATALIGITGTVTGLPSGSKVVSAALASAAAVGQTTEVVLAGGDNTIAVPVGSSAALILPPAANAQALKLKGAAGDTGVSLAPGEPTLLAFPTPAQASFILNAAGQTAGFTEISFF